MSPDTPSEVKLEIGHVLFIDIVGYSNLLITQQSEQLETLRTIVRGTAEFRAAEAEGKLLRLPTGDGGALVFLTTPEAPVLCALEIARQLKKHPEHRVRMGIHSGPVNAITDLNEQSNIAGAGINIAQRVMDCGDAGHILVSKHVTEDLEHYPRWQPYLHELGECEVKHGVRISVVNFYTDEVGNPAVPEKLGAARPVVAQPPPKRTKPLLAAGIGAALLAIIAILGALILPGVLRRGENAKADHAETLPVSAKSIAVLPFENLSRDPDNAYFVEGIQDEILTRLSKVADLKVISRTSTQKLKSAPDNLRDVARQLGVANILEGSVQKIASAVHVNGQLIRAATDEHLWAESYNRTLNDVFGVEAEVASSIAEQLNARLTGTEQKAVTNKPTQNPAAYDAYLRGLSLEHNEYGYGAYPRDIQLLSSMGNEFYNYLRRFDDALAMLNRALEISPDSEQSRANKANVLLAAGRLHEADEELARIPANSTEDWVVAVRVVQALYERQYDAVIQIAERRMNATAAGQPLDTFAISALADAGYCYAWTGRSEEATRAFTSVINELQPTPETVVPADANGSPTLPAQAYAGLGEKELAVKQAQQALKEYETDAIGKAQTEVVVAQIQAQLGERQAAIAALPHLLQVPAGVTTADLKLNPFWDPLRNDPRFQRLCQEPNK